MDADVDVICVLPPTHEHACGFGIVVVEEEAAAGVECGYGRHVFVGEGEVEDVDVLLHAFDVRGLGDYDYAALDEPP